MSNEVESSETPQKGTGSPVDPVLRLLFLLFLVVMVGYLLLPRCITYRATVNAMQCRSNLKQVMLALQTLGMCISAPHPTAGGKTEKPESANVAFADGAVVNLKNDFPLDELRKLLRYQGGEMVVRPE